MKVYIVVDIEILKLDIIKSLKPLNLNRVILFGSYAYGTANRDSDIDLYVVTNDEYTPKNWEEKSELIQQVSPSLSELRSRFPIDLIVHTKEMYKEFIELNSYFSKEILIKGSILL